MDDILHNTSNVPILLRKVNVPQTGRVFVVMGMGLEDTPILPLVENDSLKPTSAPALPSGIIEDRKMVGSARLQGTFRAARG